MEKLRYSVKLIVDVDAFDESDAWDVIQDTFGIGETGNITVLQCEYKEVKRK